MFTVRDIVFNVISVTQQPCGGKIIFVYTLSCKQDTDMKKILLPLFILILLMGWAKKQDVVALSQQIDALEKDLGPYRYGGTNPKLKLTLLSEELEESSYGSPHYNFTGVVQFVDEFPVDKITVSIEIKLIFADNYEKEGAFFIEMKGNSTAFEDDVYLTDFPDILSKVKPEIEVIRASWWPVTKLPVEVIRK